MSIVLSPEVEQQIEELVRSGRFPSADAVVTSGLWLIQEDQSHREMMRELLGKRRDEIQALVDEGTKALAEGRYLELDDEGLRSFFEQIKREGRQRLAEAQYRRSG